MKIEIISGIIIGLFFIFIGYVVQRKQIFFFLAGFKQTWEPINKEKLGNRVGMLLMTLGAIAIFTSIFTIWFGDTAGKYSVLLASINVILIIVVIGLDQIGY